MKKLQADPKHVQHVQNVWGDPLTAAGVQSRDGKAAYVQLNLAGNQGSTSGNESVKAVREIVDNSAPPKGLKVYVTGPAALTTDMNEAADKSMFKMMGVTGVVIMIMLFIAYRSISTVLLVLVMVGFEMGTARGLVALLGNNGLLGFSTFVVAMLSSLAIAAGTDYAIFLIGRYQEARQAGQDRETAYYTMFRGTFHIILGSGLTIAGATFCLHLARLSYFKALGIPSALGLIVVVAGALTAAPAVVAVASRFGLLDPKRVVKVHGWRRIGTATVRWPGPVFAASLVIALIGILIMPSMKISYNDRFYIPRNLPSNVGYAAAERHFSAATMNLDILMIESDHDMRNTGDMIILDRLAKDVFRSPGNRDGAKHHPAIGRADRAHVDTVPDKCAIDSDPAEPSVHEGPHGRHAQDERRSWRHDRLDGADAGLAGADEQAPLITWSATWATCKATLDEMRDHLADFDDFARPFRSDLYWEPHCLNIPVCWASRSVFEAIDGVDKFSENMSTLIKDMNNVDAIMPQMLAQFPPIIAVAKSMQVLCSRCTAVSRVW